VARAVWEFFKQRPNNAGARILFASVMPLTVILLRGNPTDTVARSLYLVGPIVVFLWLARRRIGTAAAGKP
jgi:hypothetical protein